MAIHFRLRDFRGQHKIKMRPLARGTGIAASTLSHLERNQTVRLELDTLARIIAFFRAQDIPCEVADLLVYEDPAPEDEG